MEHIIDAISEKAKEYLDHLGRRPVQPSPADLANLKALDAPLQNDPLEPEQVLDELHQYGSPATVASAGGRYFGFVIGGALPAALAANLLAGAWDQNGGLAAASPVASFVETVCRKWLVELLNLPEATEVGFVTGGTMANFTCLAAARHALLGRAGWDVESDGLRGAPPLKVVVGEEGHASLFKALSMLGLGRNQVVRAPTDGQGRMKAGQIPSFSEPTLICAQAGNVNTGAFDPLGQVCEKAAQSDAWVHVDGAFGLWAAASPKYAHLCRGANLANSWATDCHKWLNVPYDSGLAFVRDKEHLLAAMSSGAAYLNLTGQREPFHYVPEMSRRARGVEIWAALRSLGRKGLARLIESNCAQAKRFAERLIEAGYSVLNEVALNQVLVSFGPPEVTKRVIRRVQEQGACWCGGTEWQGNIAMRISVSSWRTTEEDVDASAEAIIRIANEDAGKGGSG